MSVGDAQRDPGCHPPIPNPTRLEDPNRVPRRETELGLFT